MQPINSIRLSTFLSFCLYVECFVRHPRSNQVAHWARSQGLGKGDAIALVMPSCPDYGEMCPTRYEPQVNRLAVCLSILCHYNRSTSTIDTTTNSTVIPIVLSILYCLLQKGIRVAACPCVLRFHNELRALLLICPPPVE